MSPSGVSSNSANRLRRAPALRSPGPEPPELYNLANDPGEEHDLAEANPDRVHQMLRELETWFEEVEADRRATHDEPTSTREPA